MVNQPVLAGWKYDVGFPACEALRLLRTSPQTTIGRLDIISWYLLFLVALNGVGSYRVRSQNSWSARRMLVDHSSPPGGRSVHESLIDGAKLIDGAVLNGIPGNLDAFEPVLLCMADNEVRYLIGAESIDTALFIASDSPTFRKRPSA